MEPIKIDKDMAHLVTSKGEIRINCPRCDDDKFHMYINPKSGLYHCFKCSASGKISDGSLTKDDVVSLEDWEQFKEGKLPENVYVKDNDITIKNLPLCGDLPDEHRKYLTDRKVFPYQIKVYGIKHCKETGGINSNRIIFPIYKHRQLSYYVGRSINPSSLNKYSNAPWNKSDTLYICDRTKVPMPLSSKIFFIVEGVFDALSIDALGYKSMALLGKHANEEQIKRLCTSAFKDYAFIIYLDEDAFDEAIRLKMKFNYHGITANVYNNRSSYDVNRMFMEDSQSLMRILSDEIIRLDR